MLFQVQDVDKAFYNRHLAGFLPSKMIDIHTHVWLKSFIEETPENERGAKWPGLVAEDNSIDDLLQTYQLMFPEQTVTPLIFGTPRRGIIFEQMNGYVSQMARRHNLPALIVSAPDWSADELARQVKDGRFLGLKPYLTLAPEHLGSDEITIFDFLPHHQLEVANAHSWIVMLHIPRGKRLRDPVNLEQMIEIERRYPEIRVIIAHIGRAYCIEDVGDAFDVLRDTERMLFDFSANTNAQVMEGLIRAVGPQRVLFGSDMPILRMRMRRICENGVYINLVPPGLYGDVSDDPHMRAVDQKEGQKLSFFMYEELLAFRQAAEATRLTAADIKDVFYSNAVRLISEDNANESKD
jgi:predicted TIM-barrel fold metal-dependent hydrolase